MLMIRLQRVGLLHDPSYRIVVTEKSAGPKAGKYVEELGHYDARRPSTEVAKNFTINVERVKYWLGVGAQASGTLHNLLVREGIVKGKKRDVRPFKVITKVEEPKIEVKAEVRADEKVEEAKEEVEEVKEEVKEKVKEEAPVATSTE